ncbi:ATP-binding protein [Agromyces sp. Marseille-P2726]|uniref:ATP-binding protein n=1 Tax=Agromyces sp. Marseille-P2726 TaxID=2709132 RepID=UPI0015707D35|nr:ATP-binding protein [Agromyces sp. Marseille-P2726]
MAGADHSAAVVAARAVVAATRGIHDPIVLIDGPSGSGKSTLADAVFAAWPGRAPFLVRLDDVYPGWHGLERAGRHLALSLVPPIERGAVGAWRRWDWNLDRAGALEHVRPGRALIIEGCGAFATRPGSRQAVRVWVEASDGERKRRALLRDGGAFDPYWDVWERQWRRYVQRASPARRADVRLRTTGRGWIEPRLAARPAPAHPARPRTNVGV